MSQPRSAQFTQKLVRRLYAQQALLDFNVTSRQFANASDLLPIAGQLAVDITEATAGFLFLRCGADSLNPEPGTVPIYRLEQQFYANTNPDYGVRPLPSQFIERAARQREILLVPEGDTDGTSHLLVSVHRKSRVLAVLDLCASQYRFDDLDQELVADLVVQLEAILQSQRLVAARKDLISVAQSLSAELDLAVLLDKVARSAAEITYAQGGSILLIQPDNTTMRFAAVYGVTEADRTLLIHQIVPLQGSVAGSVAITGKPAISNNVAEDPRFFPNVSDRATLKTRSLIAVPMIARDRPIGALEVINQKYGDDFDESDLDIISLFATQAAIAIENARLLAERQKNLAEVLKLEQRKSQFIALVSHELRTPLNIVTGYTTLLRMTLGNLVSSPDLEVNEYLQHLEQGANRLVGLVNNITSMYNLETGKTQLLLEKVSVAQIVRRVIAEHLDWSHNKGIRIVFEPPTQDLVAICDPLEVNRILGNLMNNAVKYTPEGGRVTIQVARRPAESNRMLATGSKYEIVVSVSDTGPGIDPDHLAVVYERFAQLGNHLNRSEGGIGLGLPLAKALAERHGGSLWMDNSSDVGATFSFTLPAADRETG